MLCAFKITDMKTAEVTINIYIDEDTFDEENFIEQLKDRFEEGTGYEALAINVDIEE